MRVSRATVSDIGSLRSWRSMTKTCVSQGEVALHDIEARNPDAFILGLLTAAPNEVVGTIVASSRRQQTGDDSAAHPTPAALIAAMPLVV